MKTFNLTKNTLLGDEIRVAPGSGLLISDCQGIHTIGMHYPIDVLYLDSEGVVVACVSEMKPRKMGPIRWTARCVLELPAGVIKLTKTEIGDTIISDDSTILEPVSRKKITESLLRKTFLTFI